MTKEQALEVVAAAFDKKPLQERRITSEGETEPWWDKLNSYFNFSTQEYRVKPEPREWWEVRDRNGLLYTYKQFKSIESARVYRDNVHETTTVTKLFVVHVREVLD